MNAAPSRYDRRNVAMPMPQSPLWQRPDESFPELDTDYQALRAPIPQAPEADPE